MLRFFPRRFRPEIFLCKQKKTMHISAFQVIQEGPSESCSLSAHEAYETQLQDPDFNVMENPYPCTKMEEYEWILWYCSFICFGAAVFMALVLIALIVVQPDGRSFYSMLREKSYYNMVLMYPAQLCLLGFYCMNAGFMLRAWQRYNPTIALNGTLILTIFIVTLQFYAFWMHHIFFKISFFGAVHQFYVSWGLLPYPPSLATERQLCGKGRKEKFVDNRFEDDWTNARNRRHSATALSDSIDVDVDSGANAKGREEGGETGFGFAD